MPSEPLTKRCSVCQAELEWHPIWRVWEERGTIGRHHCPQEALRAYVGRTYECTCGAVVHTDPSGLLNWPARTPHKCKGA